MIAMTSEPASLVSAAWCAAAVAALGAAVLAATRQARSATVRHRLRGAPDPGPPSWFASGCLALELPVTPEAAWPWAVRAAATASALLAVRAPEVLLAVVVVGAAARAGARTRGRRRAERKLDGALPALLDDVVAAMASGASLLQGLDHASGRGGVLGAELRLLLQRRAQGLGLQEVLDEWARLRPDTGVGLLADALALAGTTGGSQVGALRSVGDTLGERAALQREVGAMAAQAQLSATVLVIAPVAFALVVALLDRRIAAFLLASPLGWACLALGAVLDGAGAWWMRRLVGAVT